VQIIKILVLLAGQSWRAPTRPYSAARKMSVEMESERDKAGASTTEEKNQTSRNFKRLKRARELSIRAQ
jgi:hypothetical protein